MHNGADKKDPGNLEDKEGFTIHTVYCRSGTQLSIIAIELRSGSYTMYTIYAKEPCDCGATCTLSSSTNITQCTYSNPGVYLTTYEAIFQLSTCALSVSYLVHERDAKW